MRSFNRIHPVPAAVGGVVVGLSIALAVPAIAQLDLNTFQAGETTSAGDVNENFEDLSDAVRHLEDRLEAIEENKDFVEALNKYLEIYTEDEDAPEDTAVKTPLIRMTGANLQIVNQAEAQTTPDGTGNLVVGLAEERDFNVSGIDGEACSDGLIENAADCIGADETWSISHNTGSLLDDNYFGRLTTTILAGCH